MTFGDLLPFSSCNVSEFQKCNNFLSPSEPEPIIDKNSSTFTQEFENEDNPVDISVDCKYMPLINL